MPQFRLKVLQRAEGESSFVYMFLAKFVTCVAVSLMWMQPHMAYADEKPAEGTLGVVVRVRAVRAVGAIKPTETNSMAAVEQVAAAAAPEPARSSCSTKQRWDPALEDISSKLEALQYRDYKMAASQEVIVPLMKKRAVYLHDGNVLLVRPLYADSETIGLWLRWVDGVGTRLLDTRMHFNERETMLTGTELSATDADGGGSATVLAIDVNAVKPAP
jgi:hypothetical protein